MSREIAVQYYALLREARGVSEETLYTEASTPRALYQQLQATHQLPAPDSQLQVAINHTLSPWDTPLHAHDLVVFLPPFSRGIQ